MLYLQTKQDVDRVTGIVNNACNYLRLVMYTAMDDMAVIEIVNIKTGKVTIIKEVKVSFEALSHLAG